MTAAVDDVLWWPVVRPMASKNPPSESILLVGAPFSKFNRGITQPEGILDEVAELQAATLAEFRYE